MIHIKPLLILFTHVLTTVAIAQTSSDSSLTTYLNQIRQTYETGSYEELNRLFAFEGQSGLIDIISEYNIPREKSDIQVISTKPDSALVLITNGLKTSNTDLGTFISAGLSGFYHVFKGDQGWHLSDRIQMDRANRVKSHRLGIVIDPGRTVQVTDTLLVDTVDPLGFWVTLNSGAQVSQVRFQGENAEFLFQDGLLWVDKTDVIDGTLILEYSLDEQALNDEDHPYFTSEYGLLRQNFWHPMFDFGSSQGTAHFTIHAQIPARYQLTTSFPIASYVRDNIRYIQSQSVYPTEDLALLYDTEWEVVQRQYQSTILEIFVTPDYQPTKSELFDKLRHTYDLLTSKFGKCPGNYQGAVQARMLTGGGWLARTNSIIISRNNGEYDLMSEPSPRAIVAHEVSHAWTNPTGRASLFLIEGWATFVETYFLREAFGDTTVHKFWQTQKEYYLEGNYEGKASLWEDNTNGGISYSKGSWVLKILRDQLGETTFEAGFKNYIQNTITEDKDIYAFAKSMSAAAGFDVWPMLETWLKSKHIPEVKALIQDGHLVIEQTGDDIFQFPLEVALKTKSGVRTQTYTIREKKNQFPIENLEEVTGVQVDPNGEMLLTVLE